MFEDFMGTISESYDDVSSFFDDLLTEESISDIMEFGSSILSDEESSTRKVLTSSTSSSPAVSGSPMLDFSDMSSNADDGLMRDLSEKNKREQAITSVDYRTINDEWINRLRGIATNSPYYSSDNEE